MSKLILTRGLPASGKSTWAKQWVQGDPDNRVRVNRDDLRQALFGVAYGLTFEQEQLVTSTQQAAVRAALTAGKDVVVDDTNLNAKYAKEWLKLADGLRALVEWNDSFLDTPLQTCLTRDRNREGGVVGERVIMSFYRRYLQGRRMPLEQPQIDGESLSYFQPYSGTPGKPKAFLVDLDGTIAHNDGHRGFFDWAKVGNDKTHDHVIDVVCALEAAGYTPVYVSGRDRVCYAETWEWINQHVYAGLLNSFVDDQPRTPEGSRALQLKQDRKLFMRPEKDGRKDSVVKLEIFDAHIRDNYDVRFALDDRDQVVKAYREILGIPVFQVAPGDF